MHKRFRWGERLFAISCLLLALPACLFAARLSPIWSLEFSPDGRTLAVGKYQWVERWELATERVVATYEPQAGEVRSLAFSADGETLYAGSGIPSDSGEITVWDVAAESLIGAFQIHGDTVESISLNPSNTTLITASMDAYSAVVDLTQHTDTDAPVSKWLTQHVGRVLSTAYHPDGTYFLTGSEDKTIKVWDPDTYAVLVNFDANDDAVYSLAYSTEADVIVSGSADRGVRSWRVTPADAGDGDMTGALVREYNGHEGAVYSVDAGQVRLRSSANPVAMIASGSADTSVIIWRLRSGNRYATFDEPTDAVYVVRFSPDGELVAAGGRDGKVRVWNLQRRTLIHEF